MSTTAQLTESQIAAIRRDEMATSAFMRDVCVRMGDDSSAWAYQCDSRRMDAELRGE